MKKHKPTKEEIDLAERMKLAWEREHNYSIPIPKSVAKHNKETLRIKQGDN